MGREVVGLRGRKRIRWSRDGFCAGAAISDGFDYFFQGWVGMLVVLQEMSGWMGRL